MALAMAPCSNPSSPRPLLLDPWPGRTGLYPYARIAHAARQCLTACSGQPLWLVDRRIRASRPEAGKARCGRLITCTDHGFLIAWEPTDAAGTWLEVADDPPSGWREFISWTDWWAGAWAVYDADPGEPDSIPEEPS